MPLGLHASEAYQNDQDSKIEYSLFRSWARTKREDYAVKCRVAKKSGDFRKPLPREPSVFLPLHLRLVVTYIVVQVSLL